MTVTVKLFAILRELLQVAIHHVQGLRGIARPRGFARLLAQDRVLRERGVRRQSQRQRDRVCERRAHERHLRHLRFPVIHKSMAKRAMVIVSATIST